MSNQVKYDAVFRVGHYRCDVTVTIFTNRSGLWMILKDRRIHLNIVSLGLTETAGLDELCVNGG